MKTLYVIYYENGKIKKGELNESKYSELSSKAGIQGLISYPNQIIRDQNFMLLTEGKSSNKQILHG